MSSQRHKSPSPRLKRSHKDYYCDEEEEEIKVKEKEKSNKHSSNHGNHKKDSKKHKKKHHHHKHRHHSDSESSEEERKQPPTFITEDDYYLKSVEFRVWIREKKKKFFDELSSEQAHRYFKKFVNAWNKYKLNKKYYEGLRSSQLTSSETTRYKWKNLKIENQDQDQLDALKSIVDRQTNVKFASEVMSSNKSGNRFGGGGNANNMKRFIGPSLPDSFTRRGGEEDMDEEDRKRYERSLKKKEWISYQKGREAILDELVPKATGREAIIEKKKAKNEYYRREESPDVELNDRDLLGVDDYGTRVAARDRAREAREAQEHKYKSEKAKNLLEKSIAYRAKEQETMEMFKKMAEEQKRTGGGMYSQRQPSSSSAGKDFY